MFDKVPPGVHLPATHEGGRVVVHTGDDQVNEHVYKYVSTHNWKSARARGRSPLDEGTLYVARFNEDGSGDWLPLVHGSLGLTEANGVADQGDVLVKTRQAASTVGATRMDRPEWVTVDPNTGMVYLTLTNNTSSAKVMSAANPRSPTRGATSSAGERTATTTPPRRSPGTCSSSPGRVAPAATARPASGPGSTG